MRVIDGDREMHGKKYVFLRAWFDQFFEQLGYLFRDMSLIAIQHGLHGLNMKRINNNYP